MTGQTLERQEYAASGKVSASNKGGRERKEGEEIDGGREAGSIALSWLLPSGGLLKL